MGNTNAKSREEASLGETEGDEMRRIPQSATARRTGQTSITTAAIPVTRVGSPSGAGTTFTVTTGIDAAAWDLSAVIDGDVAMA